MSTACVRRGAPASHDSACRSAGGLLFRVVLKSRLYRVPTILIGLDGLLQAPHPNIAVPLLHDRPRHLRTPISLDTPLVHHLLKVFGLLLDGDVGVLLLLQAAQQLRGLHLLVQLFPQCLLLVLAVGCDLVLRDERLGEEREGVHGAVLRQRSPLFGTAALVVLDLAAEGDLVLLGELAPPGLLGLLHVHAALDGLPPLVAVR
mmetsp:Transcript_98880/g.280106  ORF Transcript_98880/g.280106 Transcript_98880/m.280106 type:complete len:203 (+) Transcript_98880:114-722(+)